MDKIKVSILLMVIAFAGCRVIEGQADDPNSYLNRNVDTIETGVRGVGALLPFPFDAIAILAGTAFGAGWRQYVVTRKKDKQIADVSDSAKRVGAALAAVAQAIDDAKSSNVTDVRTLKSIIAAKIAKLGIPEADVKYIIDQARKAVLEEQP